LLEKTVFIDSSVAAKVLPSIPREPVIRL